MYVSPLFAKQRIYAEQLNVPWFILSAEYGLVAPDEWVSPYERYLTSTPAEYQAAWGAWVVARLELLTGPLAQRCIEIHASQKYLHALRLELESRGAVVHDPLRGLSLGERLAWYGGSNRPVESDPDEDARIVDELLDEAAAVTPDEFLSGADDATNRPGLYSWWVDESGAAPLSEGLGVSLGPGLIYGGLAGATRWPSGQRSRNTLWLRITTMHLAGNHEFSTFRRTIGAILAAAGGTNRINEQELTEWMRAHLRVIAVPFDDRDELGRLEKRVLAALDPPLNLQGMTSTPLRHRLKYLRGVVTKKT